MEEKQEVPAHLLEQLNKFPKLAASPGVAVPEVVDRLNAIHERLAKLQFFPYQDDWAWLVMIANRLVMENLQVKQKCDGLIQMAINAQLEAGGFKPNIKYMG